jgi:hypothetical protein
MVDIYFCVQEYRYSANKLFCGNFFSHFFNGLKLVSNCTYYDTRIELLQNFLCVLIFELFKAKKRKICSKTKNIFYKCAL